MLLNCIVSTEMQLDAVGGLVGLMKVLNPNAQMPSNEIELQVLIDERYEKYRNQFKSCVESPTAAYSLSVSVLIEPLPNGGWVRGCWPNEDGEMPPEEPRDKYMVFTCHYVDPVAIAPKSITFAMVDPEYFNVQELMDWVDKLLLKWSLDKSRVVSVAVLAPEENPMVQSVCEGLFGHKKLLSCFASDFNSIAKRPFAESPELRPLLDAVQVLKAYLFKTESLPAVDMEGGQELEDALYANAETWLSTYDRMSGYIKYRIEIEEHMQMHSDAPQWFSKELMAELEGLVKVFKPLKEVSVDLCKAPYLMTSKVIPLVQCLLASVKHTEPQTKAGEASKQLIVTLFEEKLSHLESHEMYSLATLCDPRFKDMYFKGGQNEAVKALQDIIKSSPMPQPMADDAADAGEGFWKFHKRFAADPLPSHQPAAEFLSTKTADLKTTTNPLEYFQQEHKELQPVAERLLVSHATSYPAEKIFDEDGPEVPDSWATLEQEEIEKLLLIYSVIKDERNA